jgi:2-iminobutanoate/2-iminopropanoate deaminase
VCDRFIEAALPPAGALIGVAALFHPDVLVEVDAIAVIKS